MSGAASPLAVEGGDALRQKPWPGWPRVTEATEAAVLDALRARRWAISGEYTGETPYERRFAEAYARFHGVDHCVPTCNGSSALVVAMAALGVGAGDEVLVPGLTWVGCASAVLRAGATPVLVDVDPETLCISPDAAAAAITDRTAAIMAVHLYQSVADLERLVGLSERRGLALIEDCAQAHGARWRGRRVGSIGAIGTFSFQVSKLLASGEGGATITSDVALYDRLQQLRADGRRWSPEQVVGEADLEQVGDVQGHNYCMSEIHAAVVLEGLSRLDEENARRRASFETLRTLLEDVEGVTVLRTPPDVEPAFYQLCLRFEPEAFAADDVDFVARAMSAELGLPIERAYRPLNDNPLYVPGRSPAISRELASQADPTRFDLPTAEEAHRMCLCLPHRVLLGEEADMRDIANAVEKVRRNARSSIAASA